MATQTPYSPPFHGALFAAEMSGGIGRAIDVIAAHEAAQFDAENIPANKITISRLAKH